MRTFLYHFHGLGPYDFSDMAPGALGELNRLAADRDLDLLPTIYLPRDRLRQLEELSAEYRDQAGVGRLDRVAGLAVEGPILGPQGGIPRAGKWYPTAREWSRIAALGASGLRYIVMAPDAMALDDEVDDGLTFRALMELLYDNDVRVALGHFHRDNPARSAARMRHVLDFLHTAYVSSPFLVLTDHLYNDMPRAFTHAYRKPSQAADRDRDLPPLLAAEWRADHLDRLLGPVPAAMLQEALAGRLTPCINFDGQHVDLDIVARTVEFLGSDRLIALTDHTESLVMAGEILTRDDASGLLLRDDGAVAAGSCGPDAQLKNMKRIGLSDEAIGRIFHSNAAAAVAYRPSRRAA